MTEIYYITQNGEKVYLKDATGRELLASKQTKLKPGNGISIAEDGTISAIGGGGSAKGFFINASGTVNDLSFDKTPLELNDAIDNNKIVIVKVNNAKFILTDKKDDTYLFSYLVASDEEDTVAQLATIYAKGTNSWQEIKTRFVSIKTSDGIETGTTAECDGDVDFSTFEDFDEDSISIYGNKVEEEGIISNIEQRYYDSSTGNYIDPNDYNTNVNIDEDDIVDEETNKIIIDNKKYSIVDEYAREVYETLQDTFVLSNDFIISEDGELSLSEEVGNE